MFADGENLCLDFLCRDCWCVGSFQEVKHAKLAELIHPVESLENWTELISVVGAKTRPEGEPEAIAEWYLQEILPLDEGNCQEGYTIELASREPLGGYAARIYVVRCRSLSPRDNLAPSAWGTGETRVSLVVVGRKRLLLADRTARRWDLYDSTVHDWIEFMKRARVCRSPVQIRECP